MWHQNFVSHQEEPVQDNGNHIGSVTGFDELMEQHGPEPGQEPEESLVTPSTRSVQKYENMSAGHQHPFGVLLKEHTPETVEGISFPTVNDFRQFIDTVKSSFLTPGSDMGGYFQTARETMKNEFIYGAQNVDGESSMSNSVKEGSVHDDDSENEVWSEPMMEKSEPDANYQTESLSLFDPVDHTPSLISHNDVQDSGPGSALYYNTEARAYGLGEYGSDVSQENHNHFTSIPDEQHEDVESTSYNFPVQKPAGSLLGRIYLTSNHVTSSPVNPPDSPSQDLSHYSSRKSSIKPLTSEKIIHYELGYQREEPSRVPNLLYPQEPPSLTSYGKSIFVEAPRTQFYIPSNVSKHRERPTQTQSPPTRQPTEPHRVTVANLLYPQQPWSLNSYGKSIFVEAPRTQFYIPVNASKHRERSVQTHQPTVGKESKDINSTPTILPTSTGSVFSNSDRSPQSSSGHTRVETSRSHDPQHHVFLSRKQPIKSYQHFTVKPPSFSPDSERLVSNLRNQRVTVSRPSIVSGQARDEKSDQSEQNGGSVIQDPKQMNDLISIPTTYGSDSTLSGISSWVSDVDVTSPINFSPTSEPKKPFSMEFENEVMSRDVNSKRFPSGVRNLQGLFSYLQTRGPPHSFMQPTKLQKLPASVNREHGNRVHRLFKPSLTSKGSVSTLPSVSWRNGSNAQKGLPQKYIIQSRNGYIRGKVSLSKTRYTPYQHAEVNTAEHRWKPHPR
ncbi:uncharacterized protein LOC131470334 [Solea solea]|uniref:uncharacterized protein LOC131470334 n=1 Tax=Solea solea TaxID=90069 RepID=UPI002729FAA3|nr:uncharacterized protein LOC131470334 [Solea solea]